MSLKSKVESKEINDLFWENHLTLSTAESCTGGLLAAAITAIPGCSNFFMGGVVAYSNELKERILGVQHETLETKGAVSEETVIEMVKGAMHNFGTDCAIATTGIAGPSGGTPEKPVGTIWIAAAHGEKMKTEKLEGNQGRELNALYATEKAMRFLLDLFQKEEKDVEK